MVIQRPVLWVLLLAMLLIPLGILYQMLIGLEKSVKNLQPDIVLITIDTWRGDGMSGYGQSSISTPNLDSFAKHGIQFVRAYAPIPTTGPSHTTLLTGL
ncbi:sulfatase-like hydrolase/transferase, partial [bacterium]|nr:sulfatase-like hydrolase/transferase [candidate division CSSED10-310 bacterium]